eukprot:CAMPEP_0117419548 /NCGR_PEP_ID=MMETSP0758-20121206/1083_1 /TAXON_ID=63605 /ORGANISM="Percolomonas cosmopolitus, Strain AE-1 (ATCC 50343)" /LENGTH=125 /DNA_ID=CAMNT_0005200669 /DNA_START=1119 /DNA_END=1492 /DNA_ORIENTATION=+
MIMAVYSGLNGASVYRLSHTWDDLDPATLELRSEMEEFLTSRSNARPMRMAMDEAYVKGEPCAPYAGIYLRDIVFTEDGVPTFIDSKINFGKCALLYNIYHDILRFQGRDYNISPISSIIDEISS